MTKGLCGFIRAIVRLEANFLIGLRLNIDGPSCVPFFPIQTEMSAVVNNDFISLGRFSLLFFGKFLMN